MFAALASPRRQEILRLVWTEERAAGEICQRMSDVTPGAVSQHLRKLVEAGLIAERAEGTYRYYRADRRAAGPLRRSLERMWDDALWRLKIQAEMEEARRPQRSSKPYQGR